MPLKFIKFKKYSRQHKNLSDYVLAQDLGVLSVEYKKDDVYIELPIDPKLNLVISFEDTEYFFYTHQVEKQWVTLNFNYPISIKFLDILNGNRVLESEEHHPAPAMIPPIIPVPTMVPPCEPVSLTSFHTKFPPPQPVSVPPVTDGGLFHHFDDDINPPSFSSEYPQDIERPETPNPVENHHKLRKRACALYNKRDESNKTFYSDTEDSSLEQIPLLDADTDGIYGHMNMNLDEYDTTKTKIKKLAWDLESLRRASLPTIPAPPTPIGTRIFPHEPSTEQKKHIIKNTIKLAGDIEEHKTKMEASMWSAYEPESPTPAPTPTIAFCRKCQLKYIRKIYPGCPYCMAAETSTKAGLINLVPKDVWAELLIGCYPDNFCKECYIIYPSFYQDGCPLHTEAMSPKSSTSDVVIV